MQLLNQSAFLQSLGWAIANSLWQMALLWLCYQLITVIYKNAAASVKNTAATVLLFAGSGWFIGGLISKYYSLQHEVVLVLQGDKLQNQEAWETISDSGRSLYSFFATATGIMDKYLPYLSAAYLLLLGFLFLKLLFAWNQSHIIKTKGLIHAGPSWVSHFEHLTAQAGIKKEISLWLTEKINVPATIGFVKPIVLLPLAAINHLSTAEAETILLHELAHIKRHDYLINLFAAFAETILFFNPFAVLLATHLKKERENSCDDFVLQFHNQPKTYAMALLALEKNRMATSPLLLKATGQDGLLLQRVKRILNIPANNFNYSQRLIAFLIIAFMLTSFAWIKPVTAKNKIADKVAVQNSIAKIEPGNKIILSPAIIEKKPGGNFIFYDDKKKNSLLVKIEAGKVKLVDELNNTELTADDLEIENLKQLNDEDVPDEPTEAITAMPPLPEKEIPGVEYIVPQNLNGFHLNLPAPEQRIKIPEQLKQEIKKKKSEWRMKQSEEINKAEMLAKEWENLPSREDWEKMQAEIKKELEKLNLKIKLNHIDLAKLDSTIESLGLFSNNYRINFDNARLRADQQLKNLQQLKIMSNTFNNTVVTNDNEFAEEEQQQINSPETEIIESPAPPAEKGHNRVLHKTLPHTYFKIIPRVKTIKKPVVIVSL